MRFVSANYFRFVSHAVRSKKVASAYLRSVPTSEVVILNHANLVQEIYDTIDSASKEGKSIVYFPHTHLLWQTPSVQKYLKEKGFQLHYDTNRIDWHCDSKENKLR